MTKQTEYEKALAADPTLLQLADEHANLMKKMNVNMRETMASMKAIESALQVRCPGRISGKTIRERSTRAWVDTIVPKTSGEAL